MSLTIGVCFVALVYFKNTAGVCLFALVNNVTYCSSMTLAPLLREIEDAMELNKFGMTKSHIVVAFVI